MEVYSGVPVVLAEKIWEDSVLLEYQANSLYESYNKNGGNDRQLRSLLKSYTCKGDVRGMADRIFSDGYNFCSDVQELKELEKARREIERKQKELEKVKNEFTDKIQENSHVLIYGAGVMGKIVCQLLQRIKSYSIKAYIVNDITNNPDFIMDIPVKCYKDFIDSYEKIVIALLDEKEVNKVYMQLVEEGISSNRIIVLSTFGKKVLMEQKGEIFNSGDYWERRYCAGGNSGAGSYHHLADFKAKVINGFVRKNHIQKVIEWGCGDGNQLSLFEFPEYIGYDVSKQAVSLCRRKFAKDQSKIFKWCGNDEFVNDIVSDLSISLDVIYHLVEDEVYYLYMDRLFQSSRKYVCIYSCNFEKTHALHVRCRKFTDYVKQNFREWELILYLPNQYPYDKEKPEDTSWSDFYFYKKLVF